VSRAVYSTPFGFVPFATTPFTFHYTVPDGFVAVLRDIDVYLSNTNSSQRGVGFEGRSALFWAITLGGFASGSFQWRGRQVLDPGETIDCIAPAGVQGSGLVSGYLLTLP
jgi:hypothetical protein